MRLATLALLLVAASSAAIAAPRVEIEDAWVRWLPAGVPMAGYFELNNGGSGILALTGASSPAFGSVSIHETVRKSDGSTTMQPVDLPLEVDAGSGVTFKPGGYHLMLMQPQAELTPGDKVEITLETSSGEEWSVPFEVRNAMGK